VALQAILRAHGLDAREVSPGILQIDAVARLAEYEVQAPLVTRVFRIHYVPVQEIAATLSALVSERGSIATSATTNSLIVTDTEAAVGRIAQVLGRSE
jgi:type II secretory pathway component GspD/PulD (secretin)